jgi:hypothetical protein
VGTFGPVGWTFGPVGWFVAGSTLVTVLIEDGLELLGEEECWRLLGCGEVGRVGVTIAALPVIFPVNYTVIDDMIVFRTSAGSKLAAAAREAVVAFEVDDYERTDRCGWSVLVIGRSEVVHGLEITDRVLAAGLEPWTGGRRTDLVRITPGFLSGRHLVHADGQRPDGGAPTEPSCRPHDRPGGGST